MPGLFFATSEIEVEFLPAPSRRALLGGEQPIGTVLRGARLETRGELAPCGADTAIADDVAQLGVAPGTPVLERIYRIVTRARRLATITERTPASLFEDAG